MFFRRAKEPKGPARSGLPCGKARDLSRRERCFFSLLALAGFALQVSYWVYLRGHLFANISHYRCSFMTERTKGPAVSMRRPPTRGPQDPWTPRVVALASIFGPCRAGPPLTGRRPKFFSIAFTLVTGKPRTSPRRPRCQNWLSAFPEPRTQRGTPHPPPPLTLNFSLLA